jgi:hypothetical protein
MCAQAEIEIGENEAGGSRKSESGRDEPLLEAGK